MENTDPQPRAAKATDMIQVEPQVLRFQRPFNVARAQTVTVTNRSAERIAFKVKTTAPKMYLVRPNCGVLGAGENCVVSSTAARLGPRPGEQRRLALTPRCSGTHRAAPPRTAVVLQPQQGPTEAKTKDKFLLQTAPVPANVTVEKQHDPVRACTAAAAAAAELPLQVAKEHAVADAGPRPSVFARARRCSTRLWTRFSTPPTRTPLAATS